MKYFKLVLLAFSCFFLCSVSKGQSPKQNPKTTKTAYYYSFEGAKSLADVELLKDEIFALNGVTEFKPIFKFEKNSAQIIVVVEEKTRTSEGDKLFEITDLKKLLIKHGYVPLELTMESLPIE
jgi:hypothetical protein